MSMEELPDAVPSSFSPGLSEHTKPAKNPNHTKHMWDFSDWNWLHAWQLQCAAQALRNKTRNTDNVMKQVLSMISQRHVHLCISAYVFPCLSKSEWKQWNCYQTVSKVYQSSHRGLQFSDSAATPRQTKFKDDVLRSQLPFLARLDVLLGYVRVCIICIICICSCRFVACTAYLCYRTVLLFISSSFALACAFRFNQL